MKKKLLTTTMLSLLVLAGCGGSSNDDKKITFWHCIGHDKMRNLQTIIDKFNAEHKETDGYYIEAEKIAGAYDDLHDAVKTKLQAGNVPSITMGYPDSFSEYIGSNGAAGSKILNLDSYISSDKDFKPSEFVTEYYNEGTNYQYEGTWSVPLYKSTEAMYVNKEMFEGTTFYKEHKDDTYGDYGAKIGDPSTWDWDTLIYVATQVQAEKGAKGDFHALGYDSDSNLFITQMSMRGIKYTTAEGTGAAHFQFYDPETQTPTTGLVDLAKELFDLTQAGTLATQGSYGSYSSDLFLSKKAMITIGSTGGSSYNDPKGSTDANFTCELYAVPGYHGKANAKYIMQGPSLCFFNLNKENKQKAAWEFYSKYVSDATLNANLALENSYDPVKTASYTTDSYLKWTSYGKNDDGTDNIEAQLQFRIPALTATLKDNYMTSPVFYGSSKARTEIGSIIKYAQAKSGSSSEEKVTAAILDAYTNCVNHVRGASNS